MSIGQREGGCDLTNQIHTVVFCIRGYKILSGVQTVVDNLAQGFKDRGYEVRYITLFDPTTEPIVPGKIWVKDRFIQYTSKNPLAKDYPGPLGIKLFAKRLAVVPWGMISWIRSRLFLRTLNSGYAFIVAQPSGFSGFARLLHRTKKVDPLVICQFHSSMKGMLHDGLGKAVAGVASSSQAFVALCEGDAQAFADYLGMPVGIAHNPSLVSYRPDVAREKKLVYVGRISQEKNIELAITAFSTISDEFPDWVFDIYGPTDSLYFDKLRECADRSRHPERINFLGYTDHVDEVFSGAIALLKQNH